jgi:hypothetical protein
MPTVDACGYIQAGCTYSGCNGLTDLKGLEGAERGLGGVGIGKEN